MDELVQKQCETAAAWIRESHLVVVFTGAGISTDSGLPDYRGPDGVWTRRDAGLPPPIMRVKRSEVRPNRAHLALVRLHALGKLGFLISQNVDNLHRESGIPDDRIAELHGNGKLMRCMSCDSLMDHDEVGWNKAELGNGYRTDPVKDGQPHCPRCGGRVISSVVNFGDPMPAREMDVSMARSAECDLFLAIGSSLLVSPANEMPRVALDVGARLIVLNLGETPFDDDAQLRISAGIGDVLPAIADLVSAGLTN